MSVCLFVSVFVCLCICLSLHVERVLLIVITCYVIVHTMWGGVSIVSDCSHG